tara:strand:- start:813 stop:959 length:147 start_codon:yes stop_codon:yes gene_type:complete
MRALGDKRPDENLNTKKKQRIGFSPGPKTQPTTSNSSSTENFDENIKL